MSANPGNREKIPAISARRVSKIYPVGKGSFVALHPADLDIDDGQVTALMGPSGSGKTTLLSMIGGILRPTAGEIWLGGAEISQLSETERSRIRLAKVGFVFQSYNLFPTLTARQNVEVALDLKGVHDRNERELRARALLEEVELADKANSYPADLSGGQKQRVAIARALAGDPAIILADEPTAALDLHNGRRIMTIFHQLALKEGRAVVVVTHDSRILDLADRIVSLEDGRIAEDKPRHQPAEAAALTATLIQRPRSFDVRVTADLKETVTP